MCVTLVAWQSSHMYVYSSDVMYGYVLCYKWLSSMSSHGVVRVTNMEHVKLMTWSKFSKAAAGMGKFAKHVKKHTFSPG